MNTQTRWSLQTMAVLAAGIGLSVAASYAVQLTTAKFAAEGWLTSSLTDGLKAADEAPLAELQTLAQTLADEPELLQDSDDANAAMLKGRLANTRHDFWGLVGGDGRVLTSQPACVAALGHAGPSSLLLCDGAALMVSSAPVSGQRWQRLFVGRTLNDRDADRMSQTYNVEAELLVNGLPVGSSLRNSDGVRTRLMLEDDAFAGDDAPRFSERRLPLQGYRGFSMGHRTLPVALGDSWYVCTRRISPQVAIAFFVPVDFMIMGAKFGAFMMTGVAVVLLALLALLVWRLVRRYARPIVDLSASARAVAHGDLTRTVAVPPDREMGELCQTYNQMLQSMSELMIKQRSLARTAGMSEIATGVLHNVGNALNSINISAAVSMECANGLKLDSLRRVVSLLEQQDDLARFVTEDERGRKLPRFLGHLGEHLAEERGRLVNELRQLVENVEHVKSIVATQQTYARGGSMVERCSLSALVADALRMEATSLRSHDVDILTDVEDVGLDVDRHQMLQILVNLVSNAKQAVSQVMAPRLIHLETSVEDGMVHLSVIDNGVGIASTDAARVFTHGFTTKKDGHGFGLHHSALSAMEMGGSLSMQSEGPGAGAKFTLSLPLPKAEAARRAA